MDNILNSQAESDVFSETQGRGKYPILNGSATAQSRKEIIESISRQCQLVEIQDFIEVTDNPNKSVAYINFSIDEANALVSIKGVVKNKKLRDATLQSFTDAIANKTITENIKINPRVKKEDFSMTITLLLASIDSIKLSNITLKNKQIIIKGLVRDKHREAETINTLKQLFADDFTLINELERVVPLDSEIQDIQLELMPLPKLSKPESFH